MVRLWQRDAAARPELEAPLKKLGKEVPRPKIAQAEPPAMGLQKAGEKMLEASRGFKKTVDRVYHL